MTRSMAGAAVFMFSVVVLLGWACVDAAQAQPGSVQSGPGVIGKSGGRLIDDAAERQRQADALRVPQARHRLIGVYGGYGLAVGTVLLAGLLAFRGRAVLDVGWPSMRIYPLACSAARSVPGTSFGVLSLSGITILYGLDYLPTLIGAPATAVSGIVAVVLHAIAAVTLIMGALGLVLLAALARITKGAPSLQADSGGALQMQGQRLLLPLIGGAFALACITYLALITPLQFPSIAGMSVLQQLEVTRVWHIGAGMFAVLIAIVWICLRTVRTEAVRLHVASRRSA